MRWTVPLDRPVGAALRAVREEAGLTQQVLAGRLGTTQSAISRWERGHDEPRLSTVAEIVRACGGTASLVFDDGVDRARIRRRLALTPAQRLTEVVHLHRLASLARPIGGGG